MSVNKQKLNNGLSVSTMSVRLVLIIVFLFSSFGAQAKVTQTISAKEYEKLEQVQTLIGENKHSQAKSILDKMRSKSGLNNYTRAQISNFTGFYYYDKGEYQSALREYLNMLKDPTGIPDGVFNQTYYTVAQLYFQIADYKSALKYAKKWFATKKNPPADAYMLIGQAYFMMNDFNKALPEVQKGIDMYRQADKKPKENWLVLLRSIYLEKNDNKKSLPVVQELLRLYPKADYMFALASVYSNLEDRPKMTAVLEALYEAGLLKGKGKQMVNLANLYMFQEASYKSALILEKEMKSGEIKKTGANYLLLAQSYMLSKDYEKSLAPMEKAAASSKKASHYYDLGQSYYYLEKPNSAIRSYQKALSLSGKSAKEKEKIQLALGMVLAEKEKFTEAKKMFTSVLRRNKDSKMAQNWMTYIKSEEARIKTMKEPVVIKAMLDS